MALEAQHGPVTIPSRKRRVYFNEFNVRMGKMCYLPIVSGLLKAFALTHEEIRNGFEFAPFLYVMDSPETIFAQYDSPDIAAFSASMWNEQLNLRVAEKVKARWPHCQIVFGGPQVPHDPTEYFQTYPFIDVTVRAEGEVAFSELLLRHLTSDDFSDIPQVSWRKPDGTFHINHQNREFSRSLDHLPSPYLEGIYDELMAQQNDGLEFQAIIETNRGCPFLCTFCYWGRGGLTRKYRYHNMDRVLAEIDWFGRHKIRYVFNADSNFGMHTRDMEIAKFIVETKKRYGFPDKFRTCFGKNTDDHIFAIGHLFHQNGLEKGVTLARQSNDEATLKNIKRGNIKMTTYQALQSRFNDENIPIYTEFILGLPGESAETRKRGISEILASGLKNQLFIYMCQVYPNTELYDRDYRQKFGIVTRRIKLNEPHGNFRPGHFEPEFEEIIIETAAMPHEDWRRMATFSWVTMLLHSMKLGFFLITYLADRLQVDATDFVAFICDNEMRPELGSMFRQEFVEHKRLLDVMIHEGHGRGTIMDGYGVMYWDMEEAGFLRCTERLDQFYAELHELVLDFLDKRHVVFDKQELSEVIRFQKARIPSHSDSFPETISFSSNFPEYFERRYGSKPVPLVPEPQTIITAPKLYHGEKESYARETILWGRKSGTILVPISYEPLGEAAYELEACAV